MDQLNENYLTNLNRENCDKIIKFRTLNRNHNFIFLKIKNSIQVYEPIKLNLIYSFYLDDNILNFEISPKDSCLILNTKNRVEISELICNNLSDYDLKIKFEVKISKIIENIENLSVSTLGDIFIVIDKYRLIKILDRNLEVIKNIKLNVNFYPQNMNLFPLEYFNMTYDTKNICLSKYNHNKISLIYKNTNNESHMEEMNNTNHEYKEKIITFKDKILYLKEMQKNFINYLKYPNSSIFFILLENLNFLITRKVFEEDEDNSREFPNLIVLMHLDISTHSEYINFPYLSFSLLYDNENPIFKSHSNDYLVHNVFEDLGSGIIYPDGWVKYKNKNTLESESGILNLTTFNHKIISVDYLLFNFKENLVIYTIEGLQSHPYNNLNIKNVTNINADNNYNYKFLLLKLTKTLDRKYCIYFLDQFNLIRKFCFVDSVTQINLENCQITDSEKASKIYSNIVCSEFNEFDRKTFVLEYIQEDKIEEKKSIITILNSKLEISKILIFKGEFIKNLKWIENSNFLIFNLNNNKIGIIFVFSKFLNKKITELDEKILKDKFILIDPNLDLRNYIDQEGLNLDNILNINLDSSMNLGIDLNKQRKNKIQNNDIKFEILLITEENLILSEISITQEESISRENEFTAKMSYKFSENTSTIRDKNLLKEGQIIFNNNKFYYYEFKQKTNIFSVKEIDYNSDRHKVIFQLILLDELLYSNMFLNNYVIFITKDYINSYDISTASFYRVRNDILKNKNFVKSSLDLFKFGIFHQLVYTTNENILFIRIPRNKNKHEGITYQFNYKFEISKNYSKIAIRNNMIILNESQILRLYDITTTQHNLLFDCDNKPLIMINSNPNSLFDMETFLDFFLSNNEEIVKLILNIFCDLFKNIDNFKNVYKNSKMIPNFYKIENIDYLKKIIFDNNLNVLGQIGIKNNSIDEAENEDEDFPIYQENTIQDLQIKTKKNNQISDSKLKFKMEEDNQENNPINVSYEQNPNLKHLKNVYDVISAENTRNVDNFTKYFILKLIYKSQDLDNNNFKLSTADLCWISLINDQEYLLKFLSKSSKSNDYRNINWKFMKLFSIPLWIKNDYKLRELLEIVGKNEYKLLKEQEILSKPAYDTADSMLKNYAENVALYLFLANKMNVLIELYDKEPHNENIRKFIMRDFSVEKNRKLAKKNAGDLIDKKKYLFAAFFFLLGDDMHSALDMTLIYMKDINLTISIIRLYQSNYGNETWKKFYSQEKLYQEYFINYGIAIRDPWLTTFGYLGQKKVDLALEYILNYNTHYNFENNREILGSLELNQDEDYSEIIKKIYGINVFDYKLLIFAKNLEKVYLKLLEESKANVKSVQNTNFEDIWGMDEDDNKDEATSNDESQLKEISINYKNLSYLCIVNCLKRGVLFSPILNLYKLINNNLQMDNYCKNLLKTLICDRAILDVNYILNETNVDNYFRDIEKFFFYLEENKLVKRKEIYFELNKVALWLDSFRISSITCLKSNKIIETLLTLINFSEKLILRNISILVDFNFHENLNLEKVNDKILIKIREIIFFIRKMTQLFDTSDVNSSLQNKLIENFDVKYKMQKLEQNLYIFRIYFMFSIYLLYLSKILLSYNKVTLILNLLKEMIIEYKNLENFHHKILDFSNFIEAMLLKLSKKIKKELSGEIKIYRDGPTCFYVQILNISIISTIKNFIIENLEIKSNNLKKYNINLNDHFIQEQFKFIYQILSLTNYNIDNFEQNFEKYVKNYMTVSSIFNVHEELKMIYMKNLSQENNFFKYSLIPIQRLFKSSDKLKSFEIKFEIKKNMLRYMTNVCKFIKYDRVKENISEDSGNNINYNIPHDFVRYSQESIKIIHKVFKNGIDVINFNEVNKIQDFAINNCNPSQFAVALLNNGHKKINVLNNLLIRRRSDDFGRLLEQESNSTEEFYKSANETDFKTLIENQIFYKYNEYLTIIQEEICKKNQNILFKSTSPLPPENFNGLPTEKFLEDISSNNITNNSFCKLIESHPLLPIYITANNRGIISTWSYENESKKSLDEYYLEKITKESINKLRNLKRMKFNSYGNEFFTIDETGNFFLFDFDYLKGVKLPKITLWNTSSKMSKDAAFLNDSGLISTTNNKGNIHHTTLWDFLLPLNQAAVGEIDIGGNFVSGISDDSSLIICNDKPGLVSFVDIRRMSIVNQFQAHLDEIKTFKVSERENFLITSGKDGFVKIWDLSLKSTPLLVESFQPFQNGKDHSKHHSSIELSNGLLYASRDGNIKLLRNKIY